MTALVGITGRAQHGKDSFGKVLVEEQGYKRYGFADKLKELALYINPLIDVKTRLVFDPVGQDEEEDRVFERGELRLAKLVEDIGWEGAKQYPEVRRFLQELGTGVRDCIAENAWVVALSRQWNEDGKPNAVITDVRFPNEAAWVRGNDGIMVRVKRTRGGAPFDNGLGLDHESEAHVDSLPVNQEVTIESGDMKSLRDYAWGVGGAGLMGMKEPGKATEPPPAEMADV
jgi:hypothetical protein